ALHRIGGSNRRYRKPARRPTWRADASHSLRSRPSPGGPTSGMECHGWTTTYPSDDTPEPNTTGDNDLPHQVVRWGILPAYLTPSSADHSSGSQRHVLWRLRRA